MGSITKAMKDVLEAMGYSELRDYQRKTIKAYLSGKDVFVSAPTGAGKSVTFELFPYTFDHLFGEANAIVFVIVPLISLMKDQVSNLNSRGIRAWYVGDDCSEEQPKDILNLKEKIGKGHATEEVFRRDYGRLAEVRSLFHRDVPFVALTATATEELNKENNTVSRL
ncbi:probable ATP-dependent DNA helicase RecS [Acropora millepora]|uniref:probable ATP-dependent DNA helicase RecS n=1 Tax=Acropora millepora TaxID=45264 RepID=UPI001CF4BC5D|nr:probable ATP-dependent DNA helicase RecS [Acropora millepora]